MQYRRKELLGSKVDRREEELSNEQSRRKVLGRKVDRMKENLGNERNRRKD